MEISIFTSLRAPMAWVAFKGLQIVIEESFPPFYFAKIPSSSLRWRIRNQYVTTFSWEARTIFYLLIGSNLHHIVFGLIFAFQQKQFQTLSWYFKVAVTTYIILAPYMFKSAVFTLFQRIIADHLPNTMARIVVRCVQPLFPPVVEQNCSDCKKVHKGYGMLVYNYEHSRTVIGIFEEVLSSNYSDSSFDLKDLPDSTDSDDFDEDFNNSVDSVDSD